MPFVSYAQNHEDVVLARVFPSHQGFYIDIGAASPTHHTITRHFYELGWTGINVEPLRRFYDQLVEYRPKDTNLNFAIADNDESRPFYVCEDSIGMSTLDRGIASHLPATALNEDLLIPCMTLASLCEQYVDDRQIDFLKIDVEGYEKQVLQGMDFQKWRPIVLLIEATEPGTTIPSHHDWEPIAINAGYTFTLFDGVNRFYVRNESRDQYYDLLSYPACVHDQYVLHEHPLAPYIKTFEKSKSDLAMQIRTLQARLEDHLREISEQNTEIASLDQTVQGLLNYSSNLEQIVVNAKIELMRMSQDFRTQLNKMSRDFSSELKLTHFALEQTRQHLDSLRAFILT
ncbi:MAG: FkbM family methyltransferase [Fimbriiglobus sp.]